MAPAADTGYCREAAKRLHEELLAEGRAKAAQLEQERGVKAEPHYKAEPQLNGDRHGQKRQRSPSPDRGARSRHRCPTAARCKSSLLQLARLQQC